MFKCHGQVWRLIDSIIEKKWKNSNEVHPLNKITIYSMTHAQFVLNTIKRDQRYETRQLSYRKDSFCM